jgi:hypothetical protein
MKLFVTGVCGRLGRAIAQVAAEQGMDVVGIDIVPWPDDVEQPANTRVHQMSSQDTATIEPLLDGCDFLLHNGNPHAGDLASFDLPTFLDKTIVGSARLLEAAVRVGIKGVSVASTLEVLIGRSWCTSGAAWLDENSRPQSDSSYGTSRLLLETLVRDFSRRFDLPASCNRYCGFGWFPDEELGPRLMCRSIFPRDAARASIMAATNTDLRGAMLLIAPRPVHTPTDAIIAMHDPHAVLEKYYPGASRILEARGIELTHEHFWPMCDTRRTQLLIGWTPDETFERWLGRYGWT